MSVQTWFLMIELPLASALLILVAKRKRADRDQWTSYWYVLALGFAILSVDKIAGFHELLNSKISMSWVIPAGIVVAIFIAVYIRFLFYLPLRTRSLFINSGAEFVGGGIGCRTGNLWARGPKTPEHPGLQPVDSRGGGNGNVWR